MLLGIDVFLLSGHPLPCPSDSLQVSDVTFFTFQLIEKLKLILLETPSCDLDKSTVLQYQGSILRLQELLSLKVNVATELLLRVRAVYLSQH